jgi:thioester reductase-like protein
VYVHVLRVPEGRTVTVPNLPTRIVRITNLTGDSVSYNQDDTHTRIKVPSVAADTVDVIIKVELAEPWNTSAVVPVEFDKGLSH